MVSKETEIRVRYGETDKMGVVYYGSYPLYYEQGRTELMRHLGITYRKLEENGIMLPVVDLNAKYLKPAYYDDLLTVKAILPELPNLKIKFDYEIYNEYNELINKGYTTLVFIDALSKRPCKAPERVTELLLKYF